MLEMYEETGVLPPALASRPVLEDVWKWPYSVWQELSGTRTRGDGGASLIAFTEVDRYGRSHNCSDTEVADLWYDLHRIDETWQSEVTKMREAQAAKK